MGEHKKCKGCKWNKYPECSGIIMFNGKYMNIERLKEDFRCGQKDLDVVENMYIEKAKIEELEARITELESKVNVVKKP